MRLGLYGGSFDPIHFGHLLPVRHARQELGLDRVYYLPTARPPHKKGRRMAPARARYTMVELALLGEEGLFASDDEMNAAATSYTIDTLELWRDRHPGDELVLFLGSDSFLQLETWHRWQDILTTARIAVLMRPGTMAADFTARTTPALEAALKEGKAEIVEGTPSLDISSSAIRQHLASQHPQVSEWVPRLVLDYIGKYELYR